MNCSGIFLNSKSKYMYDILQGILWSTYNVHAHYTHTRCTCILYIQACVIFYSCLQPRELWIYMYMYKYMYTCTSTCIHDYVLYNVRYCLTATLLVHSHHTHDTHVMYTRTRTCMSCTQTQEGKGSSSSWSCCLPT